MGLLARARRRSPTTGCDASALPCELAHDLEADSSRRAGDETSLTAEAEIHVSTVSAVATTILLVRHGETDWNRENRFQGHADPPLNETGRAQAQALAREIESERVGALYASPLRRAYETATILAAEIGLAAIEDAALKEVDVGSWSGLTRTEVEARFPAGFARWLEHGHGWDDGETYDELGARVVSCLTAIGSRHDGAEVVAVTHGGPIRSALAAAEGVPFAEARRSIHVIGNCAVVRLAVRDGKLERVD